MIEKIKNILIEYYTQKNSPFDHFNLNDKKRTTFTSTDWFDIANNILKNVDIKQLYIEPIINETERLKFHRENKNSEISSNCYINNKHKEEQCKNIKMLSFFSFYPELIIKLVDNNIITINNFDYYTIFKFFVKNRKYFKNTEIYYTIKLMINYFYGMIVSKKIVDIYSENFENFDKFKSMLFDNIKKYLGDDLIYIDTDVFYYFDKEYIFNFDLSYDIENIDNFVVFKIKKYIITQDEKTEYHGFIH